ncbi:MAG TPA: TetR/AcrR family transcriptional regulator C-terminal domain-containing protein [Gaiellales bacterium]|nr:TetR/AcrR family transcriptional regulator C-terminal domain-containing protein [Gaiellales bacterium]
MSTSRRSPGRELRRAGLTRDRVLATAVQLADEDGLDGLSMRKLAKRLGVEAMSLYNHIPGKERLLDGMVDLVFDEIEAPSTGGPWKDELRNRAHSTRAALRRHPWAVGLMEARPNPGDSNRRLHEAALACLRNAGFSVEESIHAYSVQDAYIYGYALQERTLGLDTRDDWRAVATRQLGERGPAPDAAPSTTEVLHHIAEHGFSHDEQFLFGLDLILDGLEQRLPRRQRSHRSSREDSKKA